MNRSLSILFAVIFLAAQCFAVLHTAEHGFAKHMHAGKICGAYLYAEHNPLSDNTPTVIAIPLAVFITETTPKYNLIISDNSFFKSFSRAPPATLLVA